MQILDKYSLLSTLGTLYPLVYNTDICLELSRLTFEQIVAQSNDTEMAGVRAYLQLEA